VSTPMVVRTVLSQHIARVERAWFKALDTLRKLQDQRRKHPVSPVEKQSNDVSIANGSDSMEAPAGETAIAESDAVAQSGPPPASESAVGIELASKNDEQSHRRGHAIPAIGVDSVHISSRGESSAPSDALKARPTA